MKVIHILEDTHSSRISLSRKTVEEQCITDVISFYTKNGRHTLPWRKKINPYRILVSEIMLQQTQVARVIPKFELWMRQYPTLTTLRTSSLKEVFLIWQGLGYQRRAKALVTIAKEHKRLPRHFAELIQLPCVGTYTASALGAFAYNQFSHPVLETNIRTVLIEYFHKKETRVDDQDLYRDLITLEHDIRVKKLGARKWYYALMDYGAFLKENNISHTRKSAGYVKQSRYRGSVRELRAKILFAVTHKEKLPKDLRVQDILKQLEKEGYLTKKRNRYVLAEV